MNDVQRLLPCRTCLENPCGDNLRRLSLVEPGLYTCSHYEPLDWGQYPLVWGDIASALKEYRGYACQVCRTIYGPPPEPRLGVHHLNKLKGDCRPENLLVVDRGCHLRLEAGRSLSQLIQASTHEQLDLWGSCYV